jgi:hypothetical protein
VVFQKHQCQRSALVLADAILDECKLVSPDLHLAVRVGGR